jgi:hypothetical protein
MKTMNKVTVNGYSEDISSTIFIFVTTQLTASTHRLYLAKLHISPPLSAKESPFYLLWFLNNCVLKLLPLLKVRRDSCKRRATPP